MWSKRVSKNLVVCLSCQIGIGLKPLPICTESSHLKYFENKKKRNNEYRRKKRKTDIYYATGFDKESWKEYTREQYRKKKMEIINRLGGKCSVCGFEDFRALTIDHVYGDGNNERKASGWKYIKILYKLTDAELRNKYQCLCANCNTIKEFERKWIK